jgi:hypothetical protein
MGLNTVIQHVRMSVATAAPPAAMAKLTSNLQEFLLRRYPQPLYGRYCVIDLCFSGNDFCGSTNCISPQLKSICSANSYYDYFCLIRVFLFVVTVKSGIALQFSRFFHLVFE